MRLLHTIPAAILSAFAALLSLYTPVAGGQTFGNAAPIAINDLAVATPYPSQISVSGAPSSIGDLSVTLTGFSHTWVADVHVLLVSPTGQSIMLMAVTNFSGDSNNSTLTFVPGGAPTLPQALANVVSGTYSCSNYSVQNLPAPAPAGPYGDSLAPLVGTDPNGTWSLYVWDNGPTDFGAISGGWSLRFFGSTPQAVTTAFTYQGVLSAGGSPINGNANIRFTLCNNAIGDTSIAGVAPPLTRSLTDIQSGLVTASLAFGSVLDTNQSLWLNIEVESPPGSGFVTLSPRQPITPTPQARLAQRAVLADTATTATFATNVPWSGLIGQANVTTGAIGSGWQMLFYNTNGTLFRGGARLADNGFFEITNNARIPNPNFARLASTGAWTAVSDARLKTDVTTADGNLAAAMKLRPVNFRWKGDGTEDFGLIAQEVRAVLPKLVTGDETKDSLTLNYSQLSVVAIGAIQELKAENDALKARIVALENTVTQSAVTQSGMTRTQAAGLGAGVVLPLLVIAAFRRRKS
jgi:subtilisin-like proprotein convertase family protein